jgi:hypothetical protein
VLPVACRDALLLTCLDPGATMVYTLNYQVNFNLEPVMQPRCIRNTDGYNSAINLYGGVTSMFPPSRLMESTGCTAAYAHGSGYATGYMDSSPYIMLGSYMCRYKWWRGRHPPCQHGTAWMYHPQCA